jgi:hypothetical protein
MDFPQYKKLVSNLGIGKVLPDATYLHESTLADINSDLTGLVSTISNALKISDDTWNIIKFSRRDFKLTLLNSQLLMTLPILHYIRVTPSI